MLVLARVAMTSSLAIYDLGSRGVLAVAPTRLSLSPSLRLSHSSVIQIHLLSSPHSTPLLTNLLCVFILPTIYFCLVRRSVSVILVSAWSPKPPKLLHGLTSGDCNKLHLELSRTVLSTSFKCLQRDVYMSR